MNPIRQGQSDIRSVVHRETCSYASVIRGTNMRPIRTVYLIIWRWSDNSASGIVRGYNDEEEANAVLGLLKDHGGGKEFQMVAVEVQ